MIPNCNDCAFLTEQIKTLNAQNEELRNKLNSIAKLARSTREESSKDGGRITVAYSGLVGIAMLAERSKEGNGDG